jgi:vacuolar protein-sorting-associated protein 4
MSWRDVPRRMLKEPDVLVEDLYAVLEKAKPSVAQEDVDKCAEWTEKFGREGAEMGGEMGEGPFVKAMV